jgi:KDO2-lipid IV(A) lauroyltransferase
VYFLFSALEKTVRLLSPGSARKLGRVFGFFFYYLFPVRKRAAIANLRLAFPHKGKDELRRILKGSYVNVWIVIMEFFCFQKLSADDFRKMINFSNPEIIEEKLEAGKGLILLSAHFGNWELMAYGASQIAGKPFNVVVKEQSNKKVDRLINRIRELHGNRMVEMKAAPREVMRQLGENEIVAMLSDQFAPGENAVKVNFFVKGVPAYGGAAAIALRKGAAVLFGVGVRKKDFSYDLVLHEIETEGKNVESVMQEYYDLLMDYIRRFPEQYLWFHRRFKHLTPNPSPTERGISR